MGQWVSSKEFAKAHSVKIDTLYKTIQRNSKCEKKNLQNYRQILSYIVCKWTYWR